MQCLKNSKCGRGTQKQNGRNNLTCSLRKLPRHWIENALIWQFLYFSRAPSNKQVYMHLLHYLWTTIEYVKVMTICLFLNCRQLLTTVANAPRMKDAHVTLSPSLYRLTDHYQLWLPLTTKLWVLLYCAQTVMHTSVKLHVALGLTFVGSLT